MFCDQKIWALIIRFNRTSSFLRIENILLRCLMQFFSAVLFGTLCVSFFFMFVILLSFLVYKGLCVEFLLTDS